MPQRTAKYSNNISRSEKRENILLVNLGGGPTSRTKKIECVQTKWNRIKQERKIKFYMLHKKSKYRGKIF
jgi:hypothetical protein